MKYAIRGLIFISCLLILMSFIYATISHRPLLGEGSNWYLQIFNHNTLYFDDAFYRITDRLLQYPTLILIKLTDWNQIGVYLLNFCYNMHPLFSLVWCYFILRKKSRIDFFIFPVFSLVAATMPALPMAIGMSSVALSVFWPLFLLVLLADGKVLKENFLIVLLLVGLVLSYEPAIVLFIAIILAAFSKRHFKEDRSLVNLYTIIFSILSCGFLIWVIISTQKHVVNNHFIYMYKNIDTFRLFGLFSVLLLTLILLLRKANKFLYSVFFLCGLAIFSWFFYKFSDFDIDRNLFSGIGPTTAFAARATAVPMGALLGLVAIFYFFTNTASNSWLNSKSRNGILIFSCCVCLVGAICDFRTTYLWNRGYDYVDKFVQQSKGCVNMDVDDFYNNAFKSSIPDYSTAALSVIIQLANGKKEISTLVFTDNYRPNNTGRNACDHFDGTMLINNQGAEVHLIKTSLKFSDELMQSIRQ